MSNVQPGILEPVPSAARYLVFTLAPGGDAAAALVRLTKAVEPRATVIGIGRATALALGRDVPGLRDFTARSGAGIEVPSTPAALWCWLRGEDRGELVHRSRALAVAVAPAFALEATIDAFRHGEGLDLTGYEDGTENPQGEAALEAAALDGAGAGSGERGSRHGIVPGRVLRAILVAREVTARVVLECIDDRRGAQRGGHRRLEGARAVHEFASVVTTQPAPQGARGGRHFDAGTGACREVAQAGHVAAECKHERAAEADDRGCGVDGGRQAPERASNIAAGDEFEREITGEARHRPENAGLDGRHGGSCRRKVLWILARGGARQPPRPRIRIMPDEHAVHGRDNRGEDTSDP